MWKLLVYPWPTWANILTKEHSDKTLTKRLDILSNRVHDVEGSKRLGGLWYKDLCMHPNVELGEWYKFPKFKLFNIIGDPETHLLMNCEIL